MYADAGASWGHRHAILYYPYNDNSGLSDKEGFLGIGRASGGPYQGPFDDPWPVAEIIVMNVFDPCSSWDYGDPPTAVTGSASSITLDSGCASSATLNGVVNPDGTPTDYYFEYWLDGGTASSTAVEDAGSGSSDVQVSTTVGGLDPDADYNFRVVADNVNFHVEGDTVSFETPTPVVVYVSDVGDCGGPLPCYDLIQSAIESVVEDGSCIVIKVAWGDYYEDFDIGSNKNIILNKDVSLIIGYDTSAPVYTNYSSSTTQILRGVQGAPTMTIQDGSVTFWNVALQ